MALNMVMHARHTRARVFLSLCVCVCCSCARAPLWLSTLVQRDVWSAGVPPTATHRQSTTRSTAARAGPGGVSRGLFTRVTYVTHREREASVSSQSVPRARAASRLAAVSLSSLLYYY